MARQAGYNVYLTKGGSTFVGVTSDEVSIEPNTKESVTKADAGVKQKRVTSHTTNITVSGLMEVSGSESSVLYNDDIMALAMGSSPFTIVYVRGDGSNYTGTAIVSGYTESTPADPDEDSTYSLQLRLQDLHKVV